MVIFQTGNKIHLKRIKLHCSAQITANDNIQFREDYRKNEDKTMNNSHRSRCRLCNECVIKSLRAENAVYQRFFVGFVYALHWITKWPLISVAVCIIISSFFFHFVKLAKRFILILVCDFHYFIYLFFYIFSSNSREWLVKSRWQTELSKKYCWKKANICTKRANKNQPSLYSRPTHQVGNK